LGGGGEYFFLKQGICDRILYFQNIFHKMDKNSPPKKAMGQGTVENVHKYPWHRL
jgi:hypothetical protein